MQHLREQPRDGQARTPGSGEVRDRSPAARPGACASRTPARRERDRAATLAAPSASTAGGRPWTRRRHCPSWATSMSHEAPRDGAHHREIPDIASPPGTARRRRRSPEVGSHRRDLGRSRQPAADAARHACRPSLAPARRPGRPPRPWPHPSAKPAACRNPAPPRRVELLPGVHCGASTDPGHRPSTDRSPETRVNDPRAVVQISRSCSSMRESRSTCSVRGRCRGTPPVCQIP